MPRVNARKSKPRKEILVAFSLAQTVNPAFSEVLDYASSRIVQGFLLTRYAIWRSNPSNAAPHPLASYANQVVETLEDEGGGGWDGSFLEGFLEWLIENGPEIIELIIRIIGLFPAAKRSQWGRHDRSQLVVIAIFAAIECYETNTPAEAWCAENLDVMLDHIEG